MSWPRALAAWCLLAVVMIVNGILREMLLTPITGPLLAHQLSSLTGALLLFGVTWLLLRWIGASTQRDQVRLGLTWLIVTIFFEFGFGHWVAGHSWPDLVADYDLLAGRLWLIVLVATAVAPWLVGRLGRTRKV